MKNACASFTVILCLAMLFPASGCRPAANAVKAVKAARSAAPSVGREGAKKAAGGVATGAGIAAGDDAYSAGKDYLNSEE